MNTEQKLYFYVMEGRGNRYSITIEGFFWSDKDQKEAARNWNPDVLGPDSSASERLRARRTRSAHEISEGLAREAGLVGKNSDWVESEDAAKTAILAGYKFGLRECGVPVRDIPAVVLAGKITEEVARKLLQVGKEAAKKDAEAGLIPRLRVPRTR